MAHLLLLDDETDLREELRNFLAAQGHAVTEADSIASFQDRYAEAGCDIAIIDRMLPDGDGLSLVQQLRSAGARCGIVLFTARDASDDRIAGYAHGADHYITKPIRLSELGAILGSLVQRLRIDAQWHLKSKDWILQAPNGREIQLTSLEYAFLSALASQPGKPVRRRDIVAALGKDFSAYDARSLDALVMRLRKKTTEQFALDIPVKTVHGVGYSLADKFITV